jgi:hypothetical protein
VGWLSRQPAESWWSVPSALTAQVVHQMSKTKLGADYPDILINIANLALIYKNQGQWNMAEKLEIQMIEISKIKLRADHPFMLISMANLALTYRNQSW